MSDPKTGLLFVYITTQDKAQAEQIGKALVSKRLAACVNIIEGMQSYYWWEGKVEEGHECVLIAKTQRAHLEKLSAVVKSLHSYDCPCVVGLEIAGGYAPFLEWIERET